jgi:hypothetical protein
MTSDIIHQKISDFLPLAIQQILYSYENYVINFHEHEDIKKFSEHHKACKLAISNIEYLLKLQKLSGTVQESNSPSDALNEMLSLAQRRVQENEEKLLTN